jgi:predicted N-acetyltransferase YhbS
MNVTIRKATIADLQILLDINYSSFEANAIYDPYIDMNWIHTEDAKKCFQASIAKAGHYTIIAEVDKKPVGFLVLSPKRLTYRKVKMIELNILAVMPGYQCKHIGATLIAAAKKWAKSRDMRLYTQHHMNETIVRWHFINGKDLFR